MDNGGEMNIKTDARGVAVAAKVMTAIREDGVLSFHDVKDICRAVINRYDKTQKKAQLSVDAQWILEHMDSSINLLKVREVAASLMNDE